MEKLEKQIFPFFHGVPVAPLEVIGPRGDFHLFERALVDAGIFKAGNKIVRALCANLK